MGYVRARTFCCCLPVRFGVFVMTFLGLVGGSLITAAGIIQAKRTGHTTSKAGLILQIIVYLVLAIVSVFGLVGAISKRRKLVLVYWLTLLGHLLFSVIAGIVALHALFKDAPADINTCVNGSTDPNVRINCQKGMKIMKGITVTLFLLVWMIEIYGCVIVDSYVKQLAEEEDGTYKADSDSVRPQW